MNNDHCKQNKEKYFINNSSVDPHRYDDMLDLPHPVSSAHPQMSLANRAAQFSPFAALTGYDTQITEAARLTDRQAELTEEEKALLNEKLRLIQEQLLAHPDGTHPQNCFAAITFFCPDPHKSGGRYVTVSGRVKKITLPERKVIFYSENGVSDGAGIPIDDIREIEYCTDPGAPDLPD